MAAPFFAPDSGGDFFSDRVSGIAFLLLGVFVWLNDAQRKSPTPVRLIFLRWLRWALFAFVFAALFEWGAFFFSPGWEIPFPRLFLVGALAWILYDTGYTWMLIAAISRSEMPLFPRFSADARPIWPNQLRFFALKDALRKGQWTEVSTFKAEVSGIDALRLRVFLRPDRRVRAGLYFVLQPSGGVAWAVSFDSRTDDGQRLVTDNLFLPYGGFYPENWHVSRKPWMRSFERLAEFHERRMQEAAAQWRELEAETCEEINAQQRDLERVNLEMGFLTAPQEREETGAITPAGRYRLWKEILKLNYLGRTGSL